MKTFTVADIMDKEPCEEYTEERVSKLWNNKDSLSLEEILNLDIRIDDRSWILTLLVSTKTAVKWAQYCAREAQYCADVDRSAASAASAYWAARSAKWAAADASCTASAARGAAADAAAADASAYYAATYASATAYSAANPADASWDKTRNKELKRLLTKLIEMD